MIERIWVSIERMRFGDDNEKFLVFNRIPEDDVYEMKANRFIAIKPPLCGEGRCIE